jgi:hypothetical protein
MAGALKASVITSLEALTLRPCDQAAAELALTYAEAIDDGEPAEKLGPPLLSALESLGMTPRGRKALAKGGAEDGQQPRSPLDELRAKRQQRTAG